MFIICVIYVQSTYMLCYVILCYAMVGCCAVSCLKNFSAQSDSVLFCASDNKRLELEPQLQFKICTSISQELGLSENAPAYLPSLFLKHTPGW